MIWREAPACPVPNYPGLHPFVSQALFRRGYITPDKASAFLNPQRFQPCSAHELPGITTAVERISIAIEKKERICVWGDFDVDGQTATTLLVQTLRAMGGDITFHIPVRSLEGHGITIPFLDKVIQANGVGLICTCDTGISANQAVEHANQLGIATIITDHHELPALLPDAAAIINPKMLPQGHTLSGLTGVGVAYKLAEAIIESKGASLALDTLLDLVALGQIGDLGALTHDSRYLVQRGLETLRRTQRIGLHALFESAELDHRKLNETHIGFQIAPRLNSIGRLGDANPIVDFLLTSDHPFARVTASQLENYNARRKLLTEQVTQAAEARLQSDRSLLSLPVIVLCHPEWPAGVLGIAAARLVERYRKPAILLCVPDGVIARGSARSIEGVDIIKAIAEQEDLLHSFGGHPMAAGLSIVAENLVAFQKRISRTIEKSSQASQFEEDTIDIEAWFPLPDLTLELASALETLAPYGQGNPKINLASRSLSIENVKTVGRDNEHLRLIISDETGYKQEVMRWNGSENELPEGRFNLAFSLRSSDWQGKEQVQLEWVDFQPLEEKVEIRSRDIHVVDHRHEKNPEEILQQARSNPDAIIWAEGGEKERVGGIDRGELKPTNLLVIWSAPASSADLRRAMEIVKPTEIWLVGVQPPAENATGFISRLLGMIKFGISNHAGLISYFELAAALGEGIQTVQKGIAWLVARRLIGISDEGKEKILFSISSPAEEIAESKALWKELQALLNESAAYRVHFKRADKRVLIP